MTTEAEFNALHASAVAVVDMLAVRYGTREAVMMLVGACIGRAVEDGGPDWIKGMLLEHAPNFAEEMEARRQKLMN